MKQPSLELLESREVPTATLTGGLVTVNVVGAGNHSVSIDNVGAQVRVMEGGKATLFDQAAVTSIRVNGSVGRDVIQNNTPLPSLLIGGPGDDTLFGGSGPNKIVGLGGNDTVYALLGQNIIGVAGYGQDTVFTNFGAVVSADVTDTVVRFFAPGRTPGSPSIGVEADGVLYVTPANAGSTVVLSPGKVKGSVVAVYDLDLSDGVGPQTASFVGVKAISYFGGAGADVYLNNTAITEAAYGSAGNDRLTSGYGKVLLKGSGGDDVLVGRGRLGNDLSGNGGADIIFALAGQGKNVLRLDNADTVFVVTAGDVVIRP